MNVAFLPARGGSKSIPLKNIKPINGKPLIYWTVKAACECKYIDKVYIATDNDKIKATVEEFRTGSEKDLFAKAQVIERSPESASDTASTESTMLEFAEKYEFDNLVLIQATSPLLRSSDLDKGFEVYAEPATDSVMSFVRQKRFNWTYEENGNVKPTNYDVYHRPRRQEFKGYLVENGAFYITSKERLLLTKNRVSGNIKAVEMDESSFYEIDEPSDWSIVEFLMREKGIYASHEMIPEIKMFLTDCDGCLTDGSMYYSEHGDELKRFNTYDGMGFKLLHELGIITGIITSESVDLNRRRAEKLQLNEFVHGCKDKVKAIEHLCERNGINIKNVCYIGDDINDLEAIKAVGYGCCPANAMPQVKAVADYITEAKGGEGAIREVIEIINKSLYI
ncbi:MAG: N-acylneuraminate cytidylyltransferase [bacterium]|nr:N-acylneuraminate cytidylyltransferase [bacterium]